MPDFGRWTSNGGDPSLNEINRTDQFFDALAAQEPVYATDRGEAELANLLAGWRDDVRETPMGAVVTQREAEMALDRVTSPGPRRRLSLAVVGSAAAAVLCLGGFGAVVAGAGPGDALYGLRTMLFGEQTTPRDDAVILAAQTEMAQVQQLIEQGDWQAAQDKLETITTTVATVNDVERKQELVTQWQELTVKVEAQDPAATPPPGAPLPTFPEVPVVSLDPGTLIPLTPGSSETAVSETATSSPGETSTETTAPPTTTASPTTSDTAASPTPTTSEPAASPTPTTSQTAPSPSPSTTAPVTTTTAPATNTTTTSVIAQLSSSAPSPTTAAPSPTTTVAASTPSPSPTPTATPIPTPTAAPSPTPAPQPTPIPTPTAVP
ncbi:MAG: anti-sigma-D factor RsdA, partial [Mycobacterium sp.]|nr:anti-sigma-D factor RsdA [Mycobacterium sp.]